MQFDPVPNCAGGVTGACCPLRPVARYAVFKTLRNVDFFPKSASRGRLLANKTAGRRIARFSYTRVVLNIIYILRSFTFWSRRLRSLGAGPIRICAGRWRNMERLRLPPRFPVSLYQFWCSAVGWAPSCRMGERHVGRAALTLAGRPVHVSFIVSWNMHHRCTARIIADGNESAWFYRCAATAWITKNAVPMRNRPMCQRRGLHIRLRIGPKAHAPDAAISANAPHPAA